MFPTSLSGAKQTQAAGKPMSVMEGACKPPSPPHFNLSIKCSSLRLLNQNSSYLVINETRHTSATPQEFKMLSLKSVTLLLARLLNVTSADRPGEETPPQREFFYVGGEYQDLAVSPALSGKTVGKY